MILALTVLASAADLSLSSGAAFHVPEPLTWPTPRFQAGLTFGESFGLGPVRFEAQASFGTTPREGTEEVEIRGARYETAILGGIRAELAGGEVVAFGLDALAGPALLWRRTTSVVYDDASHSLSLVPRVALSAGPWFRAGPVVTAARIQIYAPFGPQWLAYGTAGVAW